MAYTTRLLWYGADQQSELMTDLVELPTGSLESLGPPLMLKADGDVFARVPQLRKLGVQALVIGDNSRGYVIVFGDRSWTPKEHTKVWDAANYLLGGGFDKRGRSPEMMYAGPRLASGKPSKAPCSKLTI